MYVFVEDLRGEGVERVLDKISAYGVSGVTVGAVHHASRDVTPHGLSRLTQRYDGAHFNPPPELFDGLRLAPVPGFVDAFDGLREACAKRSASLRGFAASVAGATIGAGTLARGAAAGAGVLIRSASA